MPMEAFEVPVRNLREARLLLDVLADYDHFQYQQNVKGNYSNAGGLQVCDTDGEWVEWWSPEDECDDFDKYSDNHPELRDEVTDETPETE